ncbi:MAG: ankyrin repeat domain-containing protein [Pirellulaceae bacterium]
MKTTLVMIALLFCNQTSLAQSTLAQSTLADAAERRDWASVEKQIANTDVNAKQVDGMTALHWAVYHQQGSTVEKLIAAKCDVNAATQYSVTPLSLASSMSDAEIVKDLVAAGADVDAKMPGGETILMIAARTGNADTIDCLLKQDAKVNANDNNKQTALMWAAAEGNADAVIALIDGGADLNATSKSGFTAMMFAAREGRLEVIKRLLAAGEDVNAVMKSSGSGQRVPRDGTSALIMAIESRHFELAKYLIDQGADPNDQRCGFAPLHMMSWVRKPNWGEGPDGDPQRQGSGNLSSMQFVAALIDAGADVNLKLEKGKSGKAFLNHKGATPVLLAGKTADLEFIQYLVDRGADPLLGNADGCTPLMACAGIGVRAVGEEAGLEPEVIETIKYLISLGADVNTVDKNKETAMHGAGYRNFPAVVEFLTLQGADPDKWNHKNRSGWTPVMIAQGHRPGSFKPSPETVAAMQAAIDAKSPERRATERRDNESGTPKLILEEGAGEGPAWHPEHGLFFSGPAGITRLALDGKTELFLPNAGSNGLMFERDGRLLICQPKQRRVSRMDVATKELTILTDSFEGKKFNSPNDITVDSKGRIYFSDPRYGDRDDMQIVDDDGRAVEGVYRIDTDGFVSRIITHEVDRPNGVLVTPDDKYLFVADNHNNMVGAARKLWRFDLNADGTVDSASKKLILDWKTGRGPDGMAIDENGTLYVAGGRNEANLPSETADDFKGGVYVLSQTGERLDFIPIPRDEVTNCTFGGPDRKTLYITAGGTLWSTPVKVAEK